MKTTEPSDGPKSRVRRHLMETFSPRLGHRGRLSGTEPDQNAKSPETNQRNELVG
jgi:hypothetical protein